MIPLLLIIAVLLFCIFAIQLSFLFSNKKALMIGKVVGAVLIIAFFISWMVTSLDFYFYLEAPEARVPGVLGSFIALYILSIVAVVSLCNFIIKFILARELIKFERALTIGKISGAVIIIAFIFGFFFDVWSGYLRGATGLGATIILSIFAIGALIPLFTFIDKELGYGRLVSGALGVAIFCFFLLLVAINRSLPLATIVESLR
ncbi:MAG: hypothetical protein GDA50_03700 [Alphaproteobacteria bacterium GM202ARS2]|nr:hypothetical protein [Alphaproteobacteria bacterium GM202ARS2]